MAAAAHGHGAPGPGLSGQLAEPGAAAQRPPGATGGNREHGHHFMDSIVESAMNGMLVRLKWEYQKELSKALQEAAGTLPPPRGTSDALRSAAQEVLDSAAVDPRHLPNTPEECTTAASFADASSHCVKDAADGVQKGESLEAMAPLQTVTFPQDGERESEQRRAFGTHGSGASGLRHTRGSDSQASSTRVRRLSSDDLEKIGQFRRDQLLKEKEEERLIANMRSSATLASITGLVDDDHWTKHLAFKIVTSRLFDFVMGAIILLNAVTIGAEASITVRGGSIPMGLQVCEYVLMLVYVLELLARFYAMGTVRALKSNWVRFDTVLVVLGFLNLVLAMSQISSKVVASLMGNVNILKMLRLARLARTVRVVVQFRTLWLLVQGLMYSVLPMCWTCIIMFCVVYIFAVAGMELIVDASDDPGYLAQAVHFDTIESSMLTLVQFITLDSMAAIYRPLITNVPGLAVYFLTFFLLGPIALMNIVTAIMVESSLRTANDDVEARKAWENMTKRQMMPKLRNLFLSLDLDGNGEVDYNEIMNCPDEIMDQIRRLVDLSELEEVFRLLDVDGSGSVTIDEFVDGILRSQVDKPSELIVLMKQGRTILQRLDDAMLRYKPTGVPRNTEWPSSPVELDRPRRMSSPPWLSTKELSDKFRMSEKGE